MVSDNIEALSWPVPVSIINATVGLFIYEVSVSNIYVLKGITAVHDVPCLHY